MTAKIKRSLFVATLLTLTSLQSAAARDMCYALVDAEEMAGDYSLRVGRSVVTNDEGTFALEDSSSTPVTLSAQDGTVVMATGAGQAPLVLRFTSPAEPDWQWQSRAEFSGISSEDLETAMGCGISQLPRLVGTAGATSAEGIAITYTYRIFLTELSEDHATFYGALSWDSGGTSSIRYVQLNR